MLPSAVAVVVVVSGARVRVRSFHVDVRINVDVVAELSNKVDIEEGRLD